MKNMTAGTQHDHFAPHFNILNANWTHGGIATARIRSSPITTGSDACHASGYWRLRIFRLPSMNVFQSHNLCSSVDVEKWDTCWNQIKSNHPHPNVKARWKSLTFVVKIEANKSFFCCGVKPVKILSILINSCPLSTSADVGIACWGWVRGWYHGTNLRRMSLTVRMKDAESCRMTISMQMLQPYRRITKKIKNNITIPTTINPFSISISISSMFDLGVSEDIIWRVLWEWK